MFNWTLFKKYLIISWRPEKIRDFELKEKTTFQQSLALIKNHIFSNASNQLRVNITPSLLKYGLLKFRILQYRSGQPF